MSKLKSIVMHYVDILIQHIINALDRLRSTKTAALPDVPVEEIATNDGISVIAYRVKKIKKVDAQDMAEEHDIGKNEDKYEECDETLALADVTIPNDKTAGKGKQSDNVSDEPVIEMQVKCKIKKIKKTN